MSQVVMDRELRSKLKVDEGGVDLCDEDGRVLAQVVPVDKHKRAVLDRFWAEFDTPEAEAQRQLALEAYRRGECLTTEQLNAEIAAFLKARGAP